MKPRSRLFLSLINIVLVCLVYTVLGQMPLSEEFARISPYLSLGFLITVAFLAGIVARSLGLPMLTGNLLAGFLFGPPVLGLVPAADIGVLDLVNALALSFIAISAGGELRLESLRRNIAPILSITAGHVFCLVPLLTGLFWVLLSRTGIIAIEGLAPLPFALLLGVIGLANSPASTIAVITEYRARGSFTDIVMSVTMLKDIVVLVLFSFTLAFISGSAAGGTLSAAFLGRILGHILLSGLLGVVMGVAMILFFRYVARELSVFIVIAAFVAHDLAHVAGLEHMFMCLVAGFTVQNFSRQGPRMIEAIESSHLPIYVVFFSIAGASMNFGSLVTAAPLIGLFVCARAALLFVSTRIAAAAVRSSALVVRWSWTAFVANAGLALSMLIVVEQSFPAWGSLFKAVMLSAIAINQIAGPIVFKIGLLRSGEAKAL